jgi:hypothetical protein
MWLLHIEDRDLWRFVLPGTKDVCAYIATQPLTVDGIGRIARTDVLVMRDRGLSINLFRDQLIAAAVDGAGTIRVAGFDIPVAHSPYGVGSDIANVLAERNVTAPFAMYWFDHCVDGTWWRQWGVRVRASGEFDAARFAERFGGGGHRKAAGFRYQVDAPVDPSHKAIMEEAL